MTLFAVPLSRLNQFFPAARQLEKVYLVEAKSARAAQMAVKRHRELTSKPIPNLVVGEAVITEYIPVAVHVQVQKQKTKPLTVKVHVAHPQSS
jgi:hypothetical protein